MRSSFEHAPNPTRGAPSSTAQHVLNAIASIEWGARVFAAGRSPDWDELSEDSLPGVFEHDTHDCDRFDIADTLESLGAVAGSMATFAESLTPEEQTVIAVYAQGRVINTTAVIRHALTRRRAPSARRPPRHRPPAAPQLGRMTAMMRRVVPGVRAWSSAECELMPH